jgi:Na+/H+-dicarboxylate symporter/ABC-type amino acid transport substrate-binding protein
MAGRMPTTTLSSRLGRWLRALVRRTGLQQLGNQCLAALVIGTLVGRLAPGTGESLKPLADLFLQTSQVVVMPFIICELVGALGSLEQQGLRILLRSGLSLLTGLWLLGSAAVLLLPKVLPAVLYSTFFSPDLLQPVEPVDLISTYVPNNIFSALAADNFPAVVLFSGICGVLLQQLPEREHVLKPLAVLRQLFTRLNRLVARIIPLGILALSARSAASFQLEQLIRVQGFFLMAVVGLVSMTLLLTGLVVGSTPLNLGQLWRISRGPLALTASSGNVLITLPVLAANLQRELAVANPNAPAAAFEELAPSLSVGFALPGLGQVMALSFLPFAAWYVGQPIGDGTVLQLLGTGIPTVVGGVKTAARAGLLQAGLPVDLLQLVHLSGEWLYRFEKVMTLEGLIVLAIGCFSISSGGLRAHPLKLLLALATAGATALVLGVGTRQLLARSLAGRYSNDKVVLWRQPLWDRQPQTLINSGSAEPVSLAAIRRRGELRVGLRRDGLPWAYRNGHGRWVGFDVDLMQELASNLGVKLVLRPAGLQELETLLDQGRIDLAVGGIQDSPLRASRHQMSNGYLTVHLALVVADRNVPTVQNLQARPPTRPLRIAVSDAQLMNRLLQEQLAERLGSPQQPTPLVLVPITDKQQFFAKGSFQQMDGLLTTAEGGAAWSVLYPQTSLVTPFHNEISGQMVILVAGDDSPLLLYLNTWLARARSSGALKELENYWITMQPPRRATPH